jgi:hypothetical protein
MGLSGSDSHGSREEHATQDPPLSSGRSMTALGILSTHDQGHLSNVLRPVLLRLDEYTQIALAHVLSDRDVHHVFRDSSR